METQIANAAKIRDATTRAIATLDEETAAIAEESEAGDQGDG